LKLGKHMGILLVTAVGTALGAGTASAAKDIKTGHLTYHTGEYGAFGSFFKSPLLPSVHGVAIDASMGRTAKEPLFRGSPMDSAQSAAAMLHAKNANKQKVVLVTTESSGHSWFIVGTSEWQEPDFVSTATMAAIETHNKVLLSAYSHADSPAWDYYRNRVDSSAQADVIDDAGNSYAMQYYDLLVTSALALEKAGKMDARKWSRAMYEVTSGVGIKVYNYADGIKVSELDQD